MQQLFLLAALFTTGLTSAVGQGETVEPERGLASGGFTDRVDMPLPPAPGGAVPSVSLVTSHTTNDGPLGAGWYLAASSTISRHSEGGGVPGYTTDNEYRVDGQRLVAVTGPGSEHFQTEAYNGARYDYDAETNTWTKRDRGWTWIYGGDETNATQRLYTLWGRSKRATWPLGFFELPVGTQCSTGDVLCNTAAWHLTRAIDPYENIIDYHYDLPELPASLDTDRYWYESIRAPRLERIVYAGAEVRFHWQERPDPRLDVSSGTPTFLTHRLVEVEAVRGLSTYSRTAIRYQDEFDADCSGQWVPISSDGPSRIREIVAIGDGDPAEAIEKRLRCVDTHHENDQWDDPSQATFLGTIDSPFAQGIDVTREWLIPITANLNNDAVNDLLVLGLDDNNNASINAYVATPMEAEPFASSATNTVAEAWEDQLGPILDPQAGNPSFFGNRRGYRFIDLDGDSRIEFLYEDTSGDIISLERSRRGVFSARTTSMDRCHLRHGNFGDINGDGLVDLIVPANGGDDDCAGALEPIWILNVAGDVDSGGQSAWPIDVPFSTTALPESWQAIVDGLCPAGAVSWPASYNEQITDAVHYLAASTSFGDANGDGLLDLRTAAYLCWTENPDEDIEEWTPVAGSWVSELRFGDGYGSFIDSGLRGGAPMLLTTEDFPYASSQTDVEEKRLLPGFSGLIDIDRSGRASLIGPRPSGDPDGFGLVGSRYRGLSGGFHEGEVDPNWGWPTSGATLVSTYANSGWSCNLNSVTPAFGDFDGDGFVDVITFEVHENAPPLPQCTSGELCPLLRKNHRSQAEGRIVASTNAWGGRTELTWSASALGDNDESPVNHEVVTEVDGSEGTVRYSYSGASVDAGGRPTNFARVERKNVRGGLDVFAYATSEIIGPKLLYAARHRSNGSLEQLRVSVYGERDVVTGELSLDNEAPRFNPLLRRCDVAVGHGDANGAQTVSIDSLVADCWATNGVSVGAETLKVALGHRHQPTGLAIGSAGSSAQLYEQIWQTESAPASIALADYGVEPAAWPAAQWPFGLTVAPGLRWTPPGELAIPGFAVAEAAYLPPVETGATPVRQHLLEWSYDPHVRRIQRVEDTGDISTTADDRVTEYEWTPTSLEGHWGQLIQVRTSAAGVTYHELNQSDFSGFDDAGVIEVCGDADRDGSLSCVSERRTYNPLGQLIEVTNPDGVATFEYDGCGLVTQREDRLGRLETTERTQRCEAETVTVEDMSYTRTFDGLRRVVSESLTTMGSPTMTVEVFRDDHIDITADDTFAEPRHAELRSDGRLILTYLDDFGRETRQLVCANAGGGSGGGVFADVSCASDTARVLSTTLYGHDGLVKVVADGFASGETPATRGIAHDSYGRPIAELAPSPNAGPEFPAWTTDSINYHVGRTERLEAGSRLVVSHTDRLSRELEVNGEFRGRTEYDALGNAIRHTAPDDSVTDIELDDFGRPRHILRPDSVSCIEPSGIEGSCTMSLEFERDWAGRVVREIHADGRVLETDYDEGGRITARRDQGVMVEQRVYELGWPGTASVVTTTDEAGVVSTLEIDGIGRPLRREILGEETTYSWGGAGELLSMTDSAGRSTAFEYETHGELNTIGELSAVSSPATGRTEIYTDGAGRVTQTIDADGVIETTEYTFGGRVRRLNRGSWVMAERFYDDLGRTTAVVNEGARTQFDYDLFNRLVERREGVDAAGGFVKNTEWTHDSGDRVLNERIYPVAGQPQTTAFTYNNYGWLTEVSGPMDTITTFAYDAAGRVRQTVDPDDFVGVTEYDNRGRPVVQTTRDRGVLQFSYQAGISFLGRSNLRRLASQDKEDVANGVETVQFTDGLGRLAIVLATDETATVNTYDGGRLTGTDFLDATGSIVRQLDRAYGEDSGRLTSVIGPYFQSELPEARAATLWEYSAAGRLLSQTTPRNNDSSEDEVTTFAYVDGLLESESYLGLTRTLTRGFAGLSLVTEERLSGGGSPRTTSLTYDDANRVTATDVTANGKVWRTERENLDYYDQPLVERSLFEGSDKVSHTWNFNALGRPIRRDTAVSGSSNQIARWNWNKSGNLEKVTNPSGIAFDYLYDPGKPARLAEVRDSATADVYWQVTARNLRGDPTFIDMPIAADGIGISYDVRGRPASRASGVMSTDLTYDRDSRIVTETISSPAASFTNEFIYDGAGRLTTELRGESGEHIDYTLDRAGNRLAMRRTQGGTLVDERAYEYQGAVLTAVNGAAINHDAWLAVTDDQRGTHYIRQPNGAVEQVDANGKSVYFTRGPEGAAWRAAESDGTRITHWGLDIATPPMEVEEATGVVRTYVRAGGQVVGVLEDGVYAAAVEHNSRGSLARHGSESLTAMTAFGEGASPPTGTDERFLFAGLESMPAGMGPMMAARHRFYDAETGRFLRPDPIGLAGGPNRYKYADGDPVGKRDPLGFQAQCTSGAGQIRLPMDELKAQTFDFASFPTPPTVFQGRIGVGFAANTNAFKIDISNPGGSLPGDPGPDCWNCPAPGGGEDGDVSDIDSFGSGSALLGAKKDKGSASGEARKKGKKKKKSKAERTKEKFELPDISGCGEFLESCADGDDLGSRTVEIEKKEFKLKIHIGKIRFPKIRIGGRGGKPSTGDFTDPSSSEPETENVVVDSSGRPTGRTTQDPAEMPFHQEVNGRTVGADSQDALNQVADAIRQQDTAEVEQQIAQQDVLEIVVEGNREPAGKPWRKFLDGLQTALDIVGMLPIPVVGEVADAINIFVSLGRGDYFGAVASGVAMVPFLGAAATAVKWVRRASKLSDEAVEAGVLVGRGKRRRGRRDSRHSGEQEGPGAALDGTGKVHGDLPDVSELVDLPTDQLREFLEELEASVQRRIEVTSDKGRELGHGERQGAEQKLIRQIKQILKRRGG